jgi:hypothetical protein
MPKHSGLRSVALTALLACGGVSWSSEPGTGQWLLETCRGDYGGDGRAFCVGYAMGLADLMLGQQRICMSSDVTSEQIRMTVEDYLTRQPEQLQQHPVVLVIRALETRFPCAKR